MTDALVSFAIERLGDLLISEAKFLTGVSHQVGEIQTQLKEIQPFLKDAENKRGDEKVGRWMAEVRDLALMMEDVIEEYALQVELRKERSLIKKTLARISCIFSETIKLHKIGLEIGSIQDKVAKLSSGPQTFGLQELLGEEAESSGTEQERQRISRMSYSHLIEKDFVGMEEEMQKLLSQLKDKDRGCEVVSIWGMGGRARQLLLQNYIITAVLNPILKPSHGFA